MLQVSNEYMDDLMVRMAHHSTAIEGNTLTQGETKSILIDNYLPRAMDMREMYEVLNFKNLLPFLVQSLENNTDISSEFCKEIHRITCDKAIEGVPGEFKISQNCVMGADWEPTQPYMVITDMYNWNQDYQCQIQYAKNKRDIVAAICRQHIRFERIHPFSDGNGRVGRALLVYSSLQNKIPPIVFPVSQKKKYISLLNTYDEPGLVDFAMELQKAELDRINMFTAGEKMNIQIDADGFLAALPPENSKDRQAAINDMKLSMKPSYNPTMRTFIEHYNRSIAKDGDPEAAAIKASKMTIKLTTGCDSAKVMSIMYDLLPQAKVDDTYPIAIIQKVKADPEITKRLRSLDQSKDEGLGL